MFREACFPSSFDLYLFAYKVNRSTKDTIAIAFHSHLEHWESYSRMLFIDYGSDFNTIITDILVSNLYGLLLYKGLFHKQAPDSKNGTPRLLS